MMTKRVFQRMLMAAAVVVIGMGMGSCTDNIDNGTTPSEKEQQEQQAEEAQQAKAQKFWAVVSQLVDVDDYTEDYAGKTFETTYGLEGAEAGTRYVYTNDLATAAARFADLVEQEGIDETTEKYTYDDPDVGTLVYAKGSGRILATVDVDIKQIPSLKKIVYMPGAYANASFDHRAYYRFGDVVKRLQPGGNPKEEVTEYWVCVRPSFGPEGKGDSHWVSLSRLPEKNIKKIETDYANYYLPTNIGTNKEHMQNLAEMIYAIYNATEWQHNINDDTQKKLSIFYDFSRSKIDYHNLFFWQNVKYGWKKHRISQIIFGYDEDDMEEMTNSDDTKEDGGLHLLYKGYSWWPSLSWDCTLYEAYYRNGTKASELNMHKATYKAVTSDMRNIIFDCHLMDPLNMRNYVKFFPGKPCPRWVVRHATGKELASDKRYNVSKPIEGVEEVYRYYKDIVDCSDQDLKTLKPEETEFEDVLEDDPDDNEEDQYN